MPPLRNEDDSARSLRREVESMAAEKPKIRTIGKYALAFGGPTGALVVSIDLSDCGH